MDVKIGMVRDQGEKVQLKLGRLPNAAIGWGPLGLLVRTTLVTASLGAATACTTAAEDEPQAKQQAVFETRNPMSAMSISVEARLARDFIEAPGGFDPGFGDLYGTRVETRLVNRVAQGQRVKVIVNVDEGNALGAAHFSLRPPLARERLEPVLNQLGADRSKVAYEYRYLPAFTIEVDATLLDKLSRIPHVLQVHEAWKVKLHLVEGNSILDSPNVWSTGHSGNGQTVAIIDTGIDYNHPDLGGGFGPSFKVVGGYDFVNDDADPMDDEGHGTAVAGIVASTHATYRGVARDADLVALKVLADDGSGTFAEIDEGLEWILDNQETFGITVANMSIGSDYDYGGASVLCNTFSTGQLINLLDSAGIATFVSAGNDGCSDRISFPACASGAISVGAVYDANLGTRGWEATCSDIECTVEGEPSNCCWDLDAGTTDVTCYSNSDDILDILAPSNDAITTMMGGGYETTFGGTSAASPYSAGAAAVLLDITDNSLSTDALRQLLIDTGNPIVDEKNSLEKPLIDLYQSAVTLDPCLAQNSDGDSCDDGDACTENDSCQDNECVGEALGCDDDNVCTDDACSPETGCVYTNNDDPCDDGDACTGPGGDTCDEGECQGPPVSCGDDNECTDDACDPDLGCVFTNNSAPCDDGDACTENDSCSGGACTASSPVDCSDDNDCTDDTCAPSTGCVHTNNSTSCDDGNACTTGDTCANGACSVSTPVTCSDDNECTDDACEPSTGCVFSPNNASCNDDSVCTTDDACSGGTCTGTVIVCNDDNECTDDSCNAVSGCVYTNNTASCDDGNPCTVNDSCLGGSCSDGDPRDCGDDNACTDDSCDPASGCVYANNTASCEDGNACTVGDSCSDGVCGAGPAVACDDGNICTDDSCDVDSGCVFVPNTAGCDDGDACTENDGCRGGECAGTPLDCDDADPCTEDSCSAGECSSSQAPDWSECGDRDACFAGACEPLPEADRCQDRVLLEVGVLHSTSLDGHHLEQSASDACEGADSSGADAFFEVALTPGTYRVDLTPGPESSRNWVLVLRDSCASAAGCLSVIDQAAPGAPEVAEPIVITENLVMILRVLGEDTGDTLATSDFDILVTRTDQQGLGGASGVSAGGAQGAVGGAQGAVGGAGPEPGASAAGPDNTSKGCGCRVPGNTTPTPPLGLAVSVLLGAVALGRRRRAQVG